MGLTLGAIADDLTGAVELAAMLRRGGVRAAVLTRQARSEDAADLDAAILGLKLRVVPARTAVSMVEQALQVLGPLAPRQIYYKYCATFDSTARGNIGPIADRLRVAAPGELTLFCPSFPEVERTVYAGHLFVGACLVSRSAKRLDPLTPMREPDLVQVLQAQTTTPVGLLRRSTDLAGLQSQVAALRAAGVAYAIADAIDEDDLARLAKLSVQWPLVTGGASLAAHYPPLWRARGWLREAETAPASLPVISGSGVVLAGSCAERTLEQLEAFARHRPVLRLDPASATPVDELAATAVAWARARLDEGPVAIATSVPAEMLARTGRRRVARRAERLLGRAARLLLDAGVRRWVVAGGETSGAVVDALGLRRLEVQPYAAPGIAETVHLGHDPRSLYLKSGKLGPVSMFVDLLLDRGGLRAA